VAHTIPHRERYLLLNHRLGRRIVQAHADWLDEVESQLRPPQAPERLRQAIASTALREKILPISRGPDVRWFW
jgi:hypothetical protein